MKHTYGISLSESDIKRFWSHVGKGSTDECWNWLASVTNRNYGKFKINGKTIGAHRIAWMITRKCEVPDSMLILHHCDNSTCCNPMHLYCGTQSDNMRDRSERSPVPSEVFAYGKAKLYEGEIWLVRKLHGKFSSRFVAKMFRVNQATICRIWRSKAYLCREGYYA